MNKWLRASLAIASALALSASILVAHNPAPEVQAQGGGVIRWATLPAGGPGHPEGLASDSSGNVYAASFELTQVFGAPPLTPNFFPPRRKGPGGEPVSVSHNYIYTFDSSGRLKTSTPLPSGVVPLGMVVVEGRNVDGSLNNLYVNDVINGDILRYALPLTSTSIPAQAYDLCGGYVVAFGAPGVFCALNANDVGPDGRIYATDNGEGGFGLNNGQVWVVDPITDVSSVWYDPTQFDVGVGSFPPYGANGIAFAKNGSAVYVANMSTDTIYKVTLTNCNTACSPGVISTFAQGGQIDGPDNMVFDDKGNLWVASGQNDQVLALNAQGQVVQRFGSFDGFSRDGAPQVLLQPSGITFTNGKIYVGNEANQNLRPGSHPIDWSQLKLFTISRITPRGN